jgi:hypothetical protein
MRIASCPHCGKREPVLIGMTVKCPRCGNTTQLLAASDFLKKAEALWPGVEVTLRRGRAARRLKEHDEFLKKRGDYDIITATLDENWTNDDSEFVDGHSEI